ncbi:MAG TPA: hypothetical protein VFY14_21965 [Streptomyces sp.]|nr:hypothetical protein [Streptomyces sp.]
MRDGSAFHALGEIGEEAVADVGDQQSHGAGGAAGQVLRHPARYVTEFGHGRTHPRLHGVTDRSLAADHMRHRGAADTGEARHIGNRD